MDEAIMDKLYETDLMIESATAATFWITTNQSTNVNHFMKFWDSSVF